MFQFAGFPSIPYRFRHGYTESVRVGSPIQISVDLWIFAPPHGFSQLITSFFGSQCQGILPALFSLNLSLGSLAFLTGYIALQPARLLAFFLFSSSLLLQSLLLLDCFVSSLFFSLFHLPLKLLLSWNRSLDRCLGCLHCFLDLQYSVFKVRPAQDEGACTESPLSAVRFFRLV